VKSTGGGSTNVITVSNKHDFKRFLSVFSFFHRCGIQPSVRKKNTNHYSSKTRTYKEEKLGAGSTATKFGL
jgi:hypothetical protein